MATSITISPEHLHQALALLVITAILTTLFALEQCFSAENRQYRHIRRLLAQAKEAVQLPNISADTKSLLATAQNDFYRATKLKEAKRALPATLWHTMDLCQQQCQFILAQVSVEVKENNEADQLGQQENLNQQRQQRNHKREQLRRAAMKKHSSGRMYW
ncbi:hypothetical protein BH11CYA1_BH11CYA1_06530 [soil metagenome]